MQLDAASVDIASPGNAGTDGSAGTSADEFSPATLPPGVKCLSTPALLVDAKSSVSFLPYVAPGTGAFFAPQLAGVTETGVVYTVLLSRSPGTNGCQEPLCELGYVAEVPIQGGTPVLVASAIQGGLALPILVGAQQIAYATQETIGHVWSVPLGGGVPKMVATANGTVAYGLSTDGQYLYWLDAAGVERVPATGGSSETLTSQKSTSVIVAGSSVILDNGAGGAILTVPSDGGSPTVVASQQDNPSLPTACGAAICWVNLGSPMNGAGGAVMELVPGRQPTALTGFGTIQSLAFDGTNLFAAEQSDVLRIPLDGSAAANVSGNLSGVGPAVVDDQCVYWSTVNGGIYSLRKDVAGGSIGP